MRILCIIWAVLIVIGCSLIRKRVYSAAEEQALLSTDPREFRKNEINFREGIKHSRFWHLWIMLFCSAQYTMFMASSFKNFGIEWGIEDYLLTTAGGIGGVCNGFSRMIWATI